MRESRGPLDDEFPLLLDAGDRDRDLDTFRRFSNFFDEECFDRERERLLLDTENRRSGRRLDLSVDRDLCFPSLTISLDCSPSLEEDELGSQERERQLSEELDIVISSSTTTWRKATCIGPHPYRTDR